MSTSRYAASNPESGVFSMSDYDHHTDTYDPFNNTTKNGNRKTNTKTEYNPLNGVSFKPSHSSDVEVVGVKYGPNNDIISARKKQTVLKNLNESGIGNFMASYDPNENNDIINIVGKGYNDNSTTDSYIPTNPDNKIDYPMSMSFKSRLRQKTQEKIEEKQKKRVERIKKQKQQNDQQRDHLNSSSGYSTPSPTPPQIEANTDNFGLSISSYSNNNNNNNKALLNANQEVDSNLDEFPANKRGGYTAYPEPTEEELAEFSVINTNQPVRKYTPTKATLARIKKREEAAAAARLGSGYTTEFTPPTTTPEKEQEQTYEAIFKKIAPNPRHRTGSISAKVGDFKDEQRPPVSTTSSSSGIKEDFIHQPFKNPDGALKEALTLLSSDDWENKCQGMNIVRRLSVYHQDLTVTNIHTISLALLQEVKNLRSQVTRFSLLTFGELFVNLKRYMDVDLDNIVKVLLLKNGETNDFIRIELEKCLDKLINNVTPQKALTALMNGGAK
jgi:hypothetical protein